MIRNFNGFVGILVLRFSFVYFLVDFMFSSVQLVIDWAQNAN